MDAIYRAEHAVDAINLRTDITCNKRADLIQEAWETERPNIRWVYARDWKGTAHYKWLYMRTPPMPCKHCLNINHNAEGAPERPTSPLPRNDVARKDWPPDWIRWVSDMRKIERILKNAIVTYETRRYGRDRSRLRRKVRTQGYKAYAGQLKELKLYRNYQDKSLRSDPTSAAEKNAYYAVLKRKQSKET